VETKLEAWWSPTHISDWLMDEYGDDEEMRVSHETIYQSLFVQGKGSPTRSTPALDKSSDG
jgi:IS30 family transposase